MATATYTLKSNGLSVINGTDIVSGQWWSRSPTPFERIGEVYEVKATLANTPTANLTGTFDTWVSLKQDQTWSAESSGQSQTLIDIQIREIYTKEIVGQAQFDLSNTTPPEALFKTLVTLAQPKSWYRMNETSDFVANDDGTDQRPISYNIDASTSDFNQPPSTLFTGTNTQSKKITPLQYLSTSSSDVAIIDGSSYTVSFAFFRLDSLDITIYTAKFNYLMRIAGTNIEPSTQVSVSNTVTYQIPFDTSSLINKWSYFTYIIDIVNNTSKLYIDNVLISTINDPLLTNVFDNLENTFNIGGGTIPFSFDIEPGSGIVDEWQLYDRVLTNQEISDHYNSWKFGVLPPLFETLVTASQPKNWYRLNETSGLIAADSGTANEPIGYQFDPSIGDFDQPPSSLFTGSSSRSKKTVSSIQTISTPDASKNTISGTSYTVSFAFFRLDLNNSTVYINGIGYSMRVFNSQIQVSTAVSSFDIKTYNFLVDTTGFVNKWVYITAEIDIVNNTSKLYIDNSLVSTINDSSLTNTFDNGANIFGFNAEGTFIIDEWQIYERILTDQERTNHYNAWKFGT